jgi:hypothetical protein
MMEERIGFPEQSVKSLTDGQQEIQEELRAWMTDLFDLLSIQGKTRQDDGVNSNGKKKEDEGENSHTWERRPNNPRRHIKLEFPKFNGDEDPTTWVCRAEQFFRFQETSEEERTALASFHLEGEAQLWFQILLREGQDIGWAEFKEGLFTHFGPNQFYDPFGELTKLQQEGNVKWYQTKFETLLSKMGLYQRVSMLVAS